MWTVTTSREVSHQVSSGSCRVLLRSLEQPTLMAMLAIFDSTVLVNLEADLKARWA